jgi:hypothetical protein
MYGFDLTVLTYLLPFDFSVHSYLLSFS